LKAGTYTAQDSFVAADPAGIALVALQGGAQTLPGSSTAAANR